MNVYRFLLAACVVCSAAASAFAQQPPSVQQKTSGACSPAIADNRGTIRITCTTSDPQILKAEMQRIAAALDEVVKTNAAAKADARALVAELERILRREPPPLPPSDIERVRAQGLSYAAKLRQGLGPALAPGYQRELRAIADPIWNDARWEKGASKETALIYRLYAASLILDMASSAAILPLVRSAMPYLTKAVAMDSTAKDVAALRVAERYFADVAAGKIASVDASVHLGQAFRVAMVEASVADVASQVELTVKILGGMMGGKPDFEFLRDYRVGAFTIGQLMETRRLETLARAPADVQVGGQGIFIPVPGGNTLVAYIFNDGRTTTSYEWEANAAKRLVVPLNDAAKELMTVGKK